MEATDGVYARMVEAAARTLAAFGQTGVWELYEPRARAVLAALQPFRDAEQAETREQAALAVEAVMFDSDYPADVRTLEKAAAAVRGGGAA